MRGPGRRRVVAWLRRYGPAEVAATLGAVVTAGVASRYGPAATAFAAAIGETLAFYAVLLVRDLRATLRDKGESDGEGGRARRPDGRTVLATVRGLLLEFGPAELVDTFVIRPGAMYVGPLLVGDVTVGVVLGKIVADLLFYALAIVAYEVRSAAR